METFGAVIDIAQKLYQLASKLPLRGGYEEKIFSDIIRPCHDSFIETSAIYYNIFVTYRDQQRKAYSLQDFRNAVLILEKNRHGIVLERQDLFGSIDSTIEFFERKSLKKPIFKQIENDKYYCDNLKYFCESIYNFFGEIYWDEEESYFSQIRCFEDKRINEQISFLIDGVYNWHGVGDTWAIQEILWARRRAEEFFISGDISYEIWTKIPENIKNDIIDSVTRKLDHMESMRRKNKQAFSNLKSICKL